MVDRIFKVIEITHYGVGDLPGRCLADGITIGINAHPDSVFAQHSACIRVVGGDRSREIGLHMFIN